MATKKKPTLSQLKKALTSRKRKSKTDPKDSLKKEKPKKGKK